MSKPKTTPKKLVIEVCERIMDGHLVPQRDKDGDIIVMESGIIPHVRAPMYHAKIKGKVGVWSRAASADEAVGQLIRDNPQLFNITIKNLGKQAR